MNDAPDGGKLAETLSALPPRADMKTICLALQGGGAHGAFTWG